MLQNLYLCPQSANRVQGRTVKEYATSDHATQIKIKEITEEF
jgi:hypothetical protein